MLTMKVEFDNKHLGKSSHMRTSSVVFASVAEQSYAKHGSRCYLITTFQGTI